eukprot:GHVR01090339.1.p3 GENE.GHVR01090339.1~~GHVR01090339.1.p3  ORF type:complete len:124 (+),score=13.70 GHVR01090339.1:644-1015(+)
MKSENLTVYAIYNAESSLVGELAYLAGKVIGNRSCALCDITHGWHPLGKSEWRKRDERELPVYWLHSDEQSYALKTFTEGRLPLVVADVAGKYEALLTKEQLAACSGDYKRFLELLTAAVDVL